MKKSLDELTLVVFKDGSVGYLDKDGSFAGYVHNDAGVSKSILRTSESSKIYDCPNAAIQFEDGTFSNMSDRFELVKCGTEGPVLRR